MKNLAPFVPKKSILGIMELLNLTHRCPACGIGLDKITPMIDQEVPSLYVIQCNFCDYMGPWADSLEAAIKSWNWGKPEVTPPRRHT